MSSLEGVRRSLPASGAGLRVGLGPVGGGAKRGVWKGAVGEAVRLMLALAVERWERAGETLGLELGGGGRMVVMDGMGTEIGNGGGGAGGGGTGWVIFVRRISSSRWMPSRIRRLVASYLHTRISFLATNNQSGTRSRGGGGVYAHAQLPLVLPPNALGPRLHAAPTNRFRTIAFRLACAAVLAGCWGAPPRGRCGGGCGGGCRCGRGGFGGAAVGACSFLGSCCAGG